MIKWTYKPQEQEGSYFFSGTFLTTAGVASELSKEEILNIYQQTQQLVKEKNGIDYLLVFEDQAGRRLFFIDQLNRQMIESGDFKAEYNYCTLLFAHEY